MSVVASQNNNIDYKLMDINYLKRYEQYNIRMTPQEEYKHNESIIKSFMKRQEELKIVIDRDEKIEMMTDEKFDNLQDKLNKMLVLQKQYNTLISDKKVPITKKYLPLPYDINEIIRNKIKEDGKNKVREDYIKSCYTYYKYKLVEDFTTDIQKVFKRRLKFNSNNALGEYDDSIREIGNKFENLCNIGYCINNNCLFDLTNNNQVPYKQEHRKLVIELYEDIRKNIWTPIRHIVNNLSNTRSNDDNDRITHINDCYVLGKNNRFNKKGFDKLCKSILLTFHNHSSTLNYISLEEIGDYWVIENFFNGIDIGHYLYARMNAANKMKKFCLEY
tara:strand:+ start:317 stop:1312 length:996 start_codon:yes stop_codon:yes gene_type:complete